MDSLTLLYHVSVFAIGFSIGVITEHIGLTRDLKKLQKNRILDTKKGTYTFTPKEKKE